MDFAYGEDITSLAELADQIMSDKATHERLRELSRAGENTDTDLWTALADSGIVGAIVPEAHGGAGLAFEAATAVLEVAGKHAAPAPLLATMLLAGAPLAQFGTPEQQAAHLPALAAGELIATATINDRFGGATAAADGSGGYVLNGDCHTVIAGMEAQLFLVPAQADDRTVVCLVAADASGLTRQAQQTTTGTTEARLTLTDVAVSAGDVLGGPDADGADIVAWTQLRADAGICALTVGLCEGAVALAAAYTVERKQFERVIASFQAVSQRAADSYIDTEAVRLTSRQAAWRISAGLPAEQQVAIARWWASEAGFRVVHAATHLHGGVGVDRDYPLHRHFLLARQLELTLGTAEEQLERMGDLLAG